MKIRVLGGSSQQRSLPLDAQRSVNFFPIADKEGKETGALYGTPGKQLFATAGDGPGRGAFTAANGRAFVVSGPTLYEIDSSGGATFRGTLDANNNIVILEENGLQLAMCDGLYLYIFTYATNGFTGVSLSSLPLVGTLTFLDGYFIVSVNGSGRFMISGLYDGLTWAALDFATAESSPDELLRVINVLGQLWLMGTKTSEVWTNTGASAFPFERISGGKLETGILAPHTVVAIDNSAIWVGRDNVGAGIVYRAQGFTPQRISTEAMEIRIQSAPNPSTLRAWTYQEDGHTFYVLTGGGMETTLVYDLSTGIWHERAYLNEAGEYELDRAATNFYSFGKQLVIDRENGKIYHQSLSYYSDDGDEIASERIFTHLSDENKRFRCTNLTIGFEAGVGTQTGQGLDPKVMLSLSNDGARTWFGHQQKEIGRAGRFLSRVIFHRLGMARERTFRIRITDPVKRAITGTYLNT